MFCKFFTPHEFLITGDFSIHVQNSKIFYVTLDAAYHIVTCKFPIGSLQWQHIMTL